MTDLDKIKNWIRSKDPILQIKQCKDILPKIFNPQYREVNPIHATDMSKPFHFLIDIKSNRIILATHNQELPRILSRIPNTFQVYNATISQISGCKDWTLSDGFDFEYPWNSKSLDVQFFINANEVAEKPLTTEEIYYYFLIQQKAVLISVILSILETMRLDCNVSSNTYQESIYREKYEQAIKVIKDNILQDYDNEYYYVADWASIKQIDLISAARDIKINHDLLHHKLCKIEYARLMFINKIREEQTLSNLPLILKEFRMFNFGYLKL